VAIPLFVGLDGLPARGPHPVEQEFEAVPAAYSARSELAQLEDGGGLGALRANETGVQFVKLLQRVHGRSRFACGRPAPSPLGFVLVVVDALGVIRGRKNNHRVAVFKRPRVTFSGFVSQQ
jgi:hypothetical protein